MSDSNQNPSKWKRGLATAGAGLAATTGAVAATPKQYNVPASNSVPAITRQVDLPRQPMDYARDLSEKFQSGMSEYTKQQQRANEIKQSSVYSQKANKTNQQVPTQRTPQEAIEAARQKASANQSGKNSTQSTNKGIASLQSKVSGQSSSTSKSSAGEGQSKGNGQGR